MHADNQNSKGLLSATLLAIVVAMVGLAGAVKLAQSTAEFGPTVGDIITFDRGGTLPRDLRTQLQASREGQTGCVLDLASIHQNGGSLIIEERGATKPANYRVHWAGQRSSDGPNDCGRDADLVLDHSSLDLLAMAAGGWGVGPKRLMAGSAWDRGSPPTRVQ